MPKAGLVTRVKSLLEGAAGSSPFHGELMLAGYFNLPLHP